MLDRKRSAMQSYLLVAILFCVISHVFSARKGQTVRSSPDIPSTQFTCVGRPPGYYADVETGCQVYHMCTEGGTQFSYKCPNTTLFQQRMLICAHSYQVNCSRSEGYYSNNLLIGQRDKHFVNDDAVYFAKEKELKTLQNPETLQNLGQPPSEGTFRQGKSHSGNQNNLNNRVVQNNFKRGNDQRAGFTDRTTHVIDSFSTSSPPTHLFNVFPTATSSIGNSFSTTSSSINSVGTSENLSSLPIAGSVLPGGLKNFQLSQAPQTGSSFYSQTFQTTAPTFQANQFRTNSVNSNAFILNRVNQPALFSSPTPSTNSIDRVNLFAPTKSPVGFTLQSSKFQPIGFSKKLQPENSFAQESSSEPSFEFLPPTKKKSPSDLVVASQENAVISRRTSTTTLPPDQEEFVGVSLPETDVKAVIEQTKNGSSPDDRFNTFIKRFNPYEEPPKSTDAATSEKPEQEYHTFINRFSPNDRPLEGQLVTGYNLEEQPGDHVFIDRFVLTPEELNEGKNRQQIDKLSDLLPPADHLTVNFPNFDLVPPVDEDSDDSESNKIELQFQDPRSAFFIPSGDDDGGRFSKADAAPIVISIPLHSNQRSSPMWFRKNDSQDSCAKCHPAFIVNKDTCTPCVIIR